MEIEALFMTIIIIIIIIMTYGLPFFFIKGKNRYFLILGIGCVLFFIISGIYTLIMSLFDLDNGRTSLFEYIAIAFFVLYPFILSLLLLVGLVFLIKIIVKYNK